MRLFNPTNEDVFAKYHGDAYTLLAGKSIDVTTEAGEWILDKFKDYGLVDTSFDGFEKKPKEYKNFVAKRAMEGIANHLLHLHSIIDNFVELDNEIKAANSNGTVLNHRRVKDVLLKITAYTKLMANLETKFGFSIAQEDFKQREIDVTDAIEAQVIAYEADNDAKGKMAKSQAEADRFIKEALGSISA